MIGDGKESALIEPGVRLIPVVDMPYIAMQWGVVVSVQYRNLETGEVDSQSYDLTKTFIEGLN